MKALDPVSGKKANSPQRKFTNSTPISIAKRTTSGFKHFGEIISGIASIFKPPERLTVSEAAEKYVEIKVPGAWNGKYSNDEAPYMVEPQDLFLSRQQSGMIFVGPAQCGKTQSLILNTVAYSILIDAMDVIIYCPSMAAARDFSMRRIDRMHRNSPEIGAKLSKERDADNKFDKQYTNGMMLSISWPSVVEFAGRPIGRVVITDRDRMTDDIDGEGEPYDLAAKRTTTFRSFAMCVAESSPSRPLTDPKWIRRTLHEAPPCGGILGLYNRGDRRRFYWPCPHCGSYFEGNFKMFDWDRKADTLASAETVRMICPNCAEHIMPIDRQNMLRAGKWLKDGQGVESDGTVFGHAARTQIASFWLNGVAAAFITWKDLVQLYITAEEAYERTGDEDALKKFYNNDLGEPYMPKSMETLRLPEVLAARAEDLGGSQEEPVVPDGVRFLLACIDVQQNMFIVQVHGICPGEPFDIVIVDRFQIRLSADRMDSDGQVQWVKPGTYVEDWDLITDQVIKRSYPLADGSGRRMAVKMTVCDSGGKAGVTANAYEYWRKLRREGHAGRMQLVKGTAKPAAPRTQITYPDSSNSKVRAAAHGDVPVMLANSNQLKDMLSNRLDCVVPGKGLIRFPHWLPDWFYVELCSEIREDKGWINPPHTRNEAWDLLYYCIALAISQHIQAESIDWNKPRAWCAEWDNNSLVSTPEQQTRFGLSSAPTYDFAALAKQLA